MAEVSFREASELKGTKPKKFLCRLLGHKWELISLRSSDEETIPCRFCPRCKLIITIPEYNHAGYYLYLDKDTATKILGGVLL